jgi:zinc D-Ala-D-Ala carboxypeptidase
MQITRHFAWEEAQSTSTGLPNAPTTELQRNNIINTAYEMEIVRVILGRKPIKINSWFRSPAVNARVGGVATSEHAEGRAVDFTCAKFGNPRKICETLLHYAHILNYNQLIDEGTWVHISFPAAGSVGKKEVLTMRNGKYTKGLT